MVGRWIAFYAGLALSQTALAGPDPLALDRQADVEVLDFLAKVAGSYATAPENRETTIIDRRFGPYETFEASGLWFYTQLNTGDDQELYRQRLHQLTVSKDRSKVTQRSFVFKESERFVDVWQNPEILHQISMEDLEPALPDGCDQVWHQGEDGIWRGKVDPATCKIFSERRQANIRIGADGYYHEGVYATSERGFDEAMNPIWGSKPGEYIIHNRCQSDYCADEAAALAASMK